MIDCASYSQVNKTASQGHFAGIGNMFTKLQSSKHHSTAGHSLAVFLCAFCLFIVLIFGIIVNIVPDAFVLKYKYNIILI
jgi:hypothetical protein